MYRPSAARLTNARLANARRRGETRAKIIEACKILMLQGIIRPDARSLASRVSVSERAIYWHFPHLRDLYREALAAPGVLASIERKLPQERRAIVEALVLGELPGLGSSTRMPITSGKSAAEEQAGGGLREAEPAKL
jgi:AcrR family transcriptional regulator